MPRRGVNLPLLERQLCFPAASSLDGMFVVYDPLSCFDFFFTGDTHA